MTDTLVCPDCGTDYQDGICWYCENKPEWMGRVDNLTAQEKADALAGNLPETKYFGVGGWRDYIKLLGEQSTLLSDGKT